MTTSERGEISWPDYTCPKHGFQGSVVGYALDIDFPAQPDLTLKRRYCMRCWIEWMDAGMCQLEEVKSSGD